MIGPGSKSVMWMNSQSHIYINGDEKTEGSRRFSIDSDTDIPVIEKLVDGLWQPASFETGPNSLWVGRNVGVAGIGHHLVTEGADGHLHFHTHSEFENGLTTTEVQLLNAYEHLDNFNYQPDDSNEWIGQTYEFIAPPSTGDVLVQNIYIKTGSIAASNKIRHQIWSGAFDTGVLVYDQTYPASQFPANSEITLQAMGWVEYSKGKTYYTRYSSDSDFSILLNASGTFPWLSLDVSYIREDRLLQTKQYVDGDTFTNGQYLIKDRKIYVCNVTGVQTGTFEDNSDKWDLLENKYIEGIFTETAIPYADAVGKLTEDPTNLFYDAQSYLHTPKLAIFDDDAILKRGHGLSIIRGADADVDILHVNTQSTSSYFRYDFSEDAFTFDKLIKYEGDYSSVFTDRALVDKEYADYGSILSKTSATTGLLEGGEITQAGPTTLSWTAGKGFHTDYTDPTNPIVTRVSWGAVIGYTPVNVATAGQYIMAYDKTGSIVEFDTVDITARKIRDYIIFGGYATTGSLITLISTSAINIGYDGFFSFKDFMRDVIGPANITGNVISANGANLKIDNNGGAFFIIGSNFRDDKEITAICIALPAELHYKFAKLALESDKDVFVEKPITLNINEAEELINIAKERNKILMVGHLLHYHPCIEKIKSNLANKI